MCDKSERTVEPLRQAEPKLKDRPAVDQPFMTASDGTEDWVDPCPIHLMGRCDCY